MYFISKYNIDKIIITTCLIYLFGHEQICFSRMIFNAEITNRNWSDFSKKILFLLSEGFNTEY